ncbi:MAG: hypothetical protein LBG13_01755 [Holosporales bacterium]|nr:hypothetical protein [Holosporales bacterium]
MGFRLGCYVAAVVLGGVVGNTSAMDSHGSAASNTAPIPEYIEDKDVMWSWRGDGKLRSTGELLNGQAKLRFKGYDALKGYNILEGEFENGRMKGKGKLIYSNGSKFEGEFKGKFNAHAPHGYGRITYHDKGVYEGYVAYGAKHGKGKLIYPDGSTYEGNFRYNEFEGEIIHTDSEGVKHIGRFKNDKFVEY